MSGTSARFGAWIAAILLCQVAVCPASSPSRAHGDLEGRVLDYIGVPQMGASVLLYDRYDHLVKKVLSDENGSFRFASLVPAVYSIQVTLASFLPAMRHHVTVQPGMRSFLAINVASVLNSIELVNTPGQTAIMSDDWKWVLRSASATRPVLRMLPDLDLGHSNRIQEDTAVFSDTRGLLRLSAGDGSSYGNETDLGTAFAVATSLRGTTQLTFSGNMGYASHSGIPTAGFRTSFSREMSGSAPELKLTMRQMLLPSRAGGALVGGPQEAATPLRSMSLTMMDRAELDEVLKLEYGFSIDSVSYLDRLNYASPFMRLSFDLGQAGVLELAGHSGLPPAELIIGMAGVETDLQQDLAAVSFFPRVSFRGGAVKVQRVQNLELGYSRTLGSRTYRMGAYRESISNAALIMAAPSGIYDNGDLMPDLASNSSIFNVGGFSSIGYTASVTQNFSQLVSATWSYGNGGVLTTQHTGLLTNDPDELRDAIHASRRHWTAAKVTAQAPWTHTQVAVGYRWTDYSALTPGHAWVTQGAFPDIGFNVRIHQQIPNFPGMPGRWEATADLRNLLAQGYLPIELADGRWLLLMQAPRSVRGGLSFVF
jgi:hypothetical protein